MSATGTFSVPVGTLSPGTHTMTAVTVDPAGNRSPAANSTVRVDLAAPTGAVTFPTAVTYNSPGYRSGCGTTTTYDVCGTASDASITYSSGHVARSVPDPYGIHLPRQHPRRHDRRGLLDAPDRYRHLVVDGRHRRLGCRQLLVDRVVSDNAGNGTTLPVVAFTRS